MLFITKGFTETMWTNCSGFFERDKMIIIIPVIMVIIVLDKNRSGYINAGKNKK